MTGSNSGVVVKLGGPSADNQRTNNRPCGLVYVNGEVDGFWQEEENGTFSAYIKSLNRTIYAGDLTMLLARIRAALDMKARPAAQTDDAGTTPPGGDGPK